MDWKIVHCQISIMAVCYICRFVSEHVRYIVTTRKRFAVSNVETVVSVKYEKHTEAILLFELGVTVLCFSLRLISLLVDGVYKGVITYQFLYAVTHALTVLSITSFLRFASSRSEREPETREKSVHLETLFLENVIFVLILWTFAFAGDYETGALKELSFSVSAAIGVASGLACICILY